MRAGALILVLCCATSACAIVRPPAWPDPEPEPLVIEATPGHMYGYAPISWDVPTGETITIAVDRASVTSGLGLYHADIAFTAALDGEQLRCESEPAGPGVPSTRFGCWSEGVTFWLAPGHDCPPRHAAHASTLTTPACWDGELTVDGQRTLLHHGYVEATGAPVGYVSWTTEAGELQLAADTVSSMQVRIYAASKALSDRARRRLVLLTVALSWWEHAARPE